MTFALHFVMALGTLRTLSEEKMKSSSAQRCTGIGQDAADTSWCVGNPNDI